MAGEKKYTKRRLIRLSVETDEKLVARAKQAGMKPAVLGRMLIQSGLGRGK